MTADRSLIARLAAHESWARTTGPTARTDPARRALSDRFVREVDPDGVLPPDERARRAARARKAYFTRLALRSAQARRSRSGAEPVTAAKETSAGSTSRPASARRPLRLDTVLPVAPARRALLAVLRPEELAR